MRGVLRLLQRWGLVAIGVTILMIAGEFDLSVRAVFVLAPMVMAVSMVAAVPFVPAVLLGLLGRRVFQFSRWLHHAALRHPVLHHPAFRRAFSRTLGHGAPTQSGIFI